MCHPEVPAGTPLPDVRCEEIEVGVPDGGRMPALLALPARMPAPGVLVVNDVFGTSPFYEHLTRRIAQAGFVALDVEYFFREGPVPAGDRPAAQARAQRLDQGRTAADLGAALDALAARPEAAIGRLGTIGFCMGGTLVLDLAALRDGLATVSYYGFPARPRDGVPTPLEVAARMHGPILGHWGTADDGVGMDNVRELDRRLTAARVDHEFHLYDGLPHGFLRAALDDESAPHHRAACDSWTRTLDFWRATLGSARAEGRRAG